MKFNENGIIEPGLHTSTIPEVCEFLVNNFDTSQTRKKIFDNFIKFFSLLVKNFKVYEIWIDGSFTTAKINPNDIDVVVFFYVESFNSIVGKWESIRQIPNLDVYPAVAICDDTMKKLSPQDYGEQINNRNYWKGQFGYSRDDIPKGIIVLNETALKSFVGGDSNVNDNN